MLFGFLLRTLCQLIYSAAIGTERFEAGIEKHPVKSLICRLEPEADHCRAGELELGKSKNVRQPKALFKICFGVMIHTAFLNKNMQPRLSQGKGVSAST